MEDNNFGWSETQFLEVQKRIQGGDTTTLKDKLMPLKKRTNKEGKTISYRVLASCTESCVADTSSLLCAWLGADDTTLSDKQKKQINEFVINTLSVLEQAIQSETVKYGDLKGWVRDKTFDALKVKYTEQNFGWTPDRFLDIKKEVEAGNLKNFRRELELNLKPSLRYAMNLAKKVVQKEYLDSTDKDFFKFAISDALIRFEDRMAVISGNNQPIIREIENWEEDEMPISDQDEAENLLPVNYGNLGAWFAGNVSDRFKTFCMQEQRYKWLFETTDVIPEMSFNAHQEESFITRLVAEALKRVPNNDPYYYRDMLRKRYLEDCRVGKLAEEMGVRSDTMTHRIEQSERLFKREWDNVLTKYNIRLPARYTPI